MSEPQPYGPILRRTFETKLHVVSTEEARRRRRRRRNRSRFAIATDLDRRLRALGHGDGYSGFSGSQGVP
jgi:hypothetical protein